MGRKAGTEVGVNSCLVAFIATESVSIALSWLLLPPEVGINRHGLFFTVDDCNWTSAWRVPGALSTIRYQESQGSLAVVVDRTFTRGAWDMRASLFTDHRRIILFFACLIFMVDLD